MSINTQGFSRDILNKFVPFYDEILKTAEYLKSDAYIVGGSVRDLLLNKAIKDTDIVPFGVNYEKFARTLAKSINAPSIPFKDNVRIIKQDSITDVSAPRGKKIEDDLNLRDFTINNMACDLSGKIIGDPSDLENKIIRAVYDKTFDDDPLRILRGFRFKSVLGFKIHGDTEKLILQKKNLIIIPAKERVLEELKKTFEGPYFTTLLKDESFITIMKILTNGSEINIDNAARLKNKAKTHLNLFPIFLSVFFEGSSGTAFIESLPLSVHDMKAVKNLLRANENINFKKLENEEERLKTTWKYYNIFNDLILYLESKYPRHKDIIDKLKKNPEKLNISKADLIKGEDLKKMGFEPSPLFAIIIGDVKEKLVMGMIDPKDIKQYIKNKFIS